MIDEENRTRLQTILMVAAVPPFFERAGIKDSTRQEVCNDPSQLAIPCSHMSSLVGPQMSPWPQRFEGAYWAAVKEHLSCHNMDIR